MLLGDIENICNSQVPDYLKNKEIKGLAYDSRKVNEGFLFFSIKGQKTDGRLFIKDAFSKKAIAVVSQDCSDIENCIEVKDIRKCMGKIANYFYNQPSKKLNVVGITGTNGKTTTTYLLKEIFEKSGIIGTTGYRFNHVVKKLENTTPESIDLNKILLEMMPNVDYVFMEVSSHAVTFDRIEGIDFKLKVFTNLSQDHLDFYQTMENYAKAKAAFFKENDFRVVNIDDNLGKTLYKKGFTITYGFKDSDIYPLYYKFDINGIYLKLNVFGDVYEIQSNLIGIYNIYNIMAAVGCSVFFGKPKAQVLQALYNFKNVPGRLEKFIKNGKAAIVDYAHTDDAIKNVLQTLKTITKGKLIVVFGAGGDRDKTKRPKMGKVASSIADIIIITNDNPRTENPDAIINDILEGVDKSKKIIIEKDRKLAIIKGLESTSEGDCVAILGKGHEDYQIIGEKKYHFDDREVVRDFWNVESK
ncbi:MAG: UDP-N-acetylmuramoyl-L-alanyl-D-glutamate--2,6-diaminopimelate ligase [Desulfurella sp.]|jgi:UDP-N-acetylmuramoyl-L-alanyl-D-glutamate--2,6-diaminopimelate ligase|uniref:UDP-N-acetylmuramoyl-L-alanyl-D-glutamate--2, 6-diaminopimelate ligase n=1 Tax=Desulfurella sp. TaxID=1962857 RepID=UPI000CAE3A15|nr:UDP-N-acetylmuramoyl-L-alanyl-D-glutamate--2,6-diaminopimelate ligase [Desulfurella sp.]PMP89842.1 MAG: UDP-N-acetylmuramoyl-L-alanyl-D-glutamate--2,6-diaminopimelate ligase [Desulfurella sp.]HEX13698.1 UDP-N-acetylmuramoyl-L-alanyl-D-glutamate--2,6-diaminopimelate ligase [Desulfurella acetivorans]